MSNQNFVLKSQKALHDGEHSRVILFCGVKNGKKDFLVMKILRDKNRDIYRSIVSSHMSTLLKLNHQNIAKFFILPQEVDRSERIYSHLAMEYCDWGDLRMVLKQPKSFDGMGQREAFSIMRDLSSAVFYLHDNKIVHGDLRPENVLLKRENNKIVYKLIGITFLPYCCLKPRQSSDYCHVKYIDYPRGSIENTIPRSIDFWSLGVLFNEVLTGVLRRTRDDIIKSLRENENRYLCAEVVGNVKCGQDVCTNRVLLSKMTKWFENVFRETENAELLKQARSSLEQIVSLKIVNVFLAPLHKKVSYIIDQDTDVGSLKKKIAEKCKCDLQHLILYNKTTKTVLEYPNEKIFSQNEKLGELLLAFEITSTKADCQLYAGPYIEKSKQMMLSLRDESVLYECTLLVLGKRQDMIQNDIEGLQDQISKLRINDLSELKDKIEQLQNQEEIQKQIEMPVDDVLNGIDSLNQKIVMISDSLTRIDKRSSELKTSILDFVTKNNHKETMGKMFDLLFPLTGSATDDKFWSQVYSYQQAFSDKYNNLLKKIGPMEAELLVIKKVFESLKLQEVISNYKFCNLLTLVEELQLSESLKEKINLTNSNEEKEEEKALANPKEIEPPNPKEKIEPPNPKEGMEPTSSKASCSSTAAVAQKPDLTKTDSLVLESFVMQQKIENLMKLMNKKLKCSSDL